MSFGEEIMEIRYSLLLSQEALASQLGLAYGTVSRWENGKSLPSLSTMGTLLKYCEKNGIDKDAVLRSWKEEQKKGRV